MKSRRLWIALAAVVVAAVVFRIGYHWLTGSILPNVLRTQLTAALERDVAFKRVDTDLFSYFSVQELVVAKGDSLKSGSAMTVKELVIKYKLIRLLLYPKAWTKAIRRVEVVSPHFELAMEEVFPKGRSRGKDADGQQVSAALPPLPKTFMLVKDGRVILTRRGRPVMEVRGFRGNLDLRDLPRIEGSVKFVISPEASLAAEGYCHLGMRSFKGGLAIEGLDLGQFSDLARLANPALGVRVGGRLRADLEVQGGFMTFDELVGKTEGEGSLHLDAGAIEVGGSPVVTDMSASGALDGRNISLDRLAANVLSGELDAAGTLANLGLGSLRMRGKLVDVPVQALRVLSPGLPQDLVGTLTFEFSATRTGRAPIFNGKLSAPALGVPWLLAKDVIAEAEYSIDEIDLTNLKARLWEGTFEGDGSLRGLNSSVQEVEFSLEGKDLNVSLSPIGKEARFAGRADLSVDLAGTTKGLTGDARARFSEVKAKGVPLSDVTASAHFAKGRVAIDAQTAKRSVVVSGDLLFGDRLTCEGCRARVQERLPVILALSGVKPPKNFQGQVSGSITLEGPVVDPIVTVDAFASGVRFGKIVVGDQIRVPRFIYRDLKLIVPEIHPMELRWIPQSTVVTAYGTLPIGVFTASGVEPVDFHLKLLKGRMDVLKRLDMLRTSEGGLTVVADVSGTASYPVWSYTVAGAGRRIEFGTQLFSEPISRWELDARMLNNEGILKAGITVGKHRQMLAGEFSMGGWKLGHLDVSTWTAAVSGNEDDLKGIPLEIEDFAEIRLKVFGRLVKEGNSEDVFITGKTPETPAELNLSRGVITYAGGERRKGDSGTQSWFGAWAEKSLGIQGLLSFGEGVVYRPKTYTEKAVGDVLKAVRGAKKEEGKGSLKKYDLLSLVTGVMQDLSVGFNVPVMEGSSLYILKRGDLVTAKGVLTLEEGGEVSLAGKEFVVGGDSGTKNYIEFKPGDELSAYVNITSETILFNKYLLADSGDKVHVDELKVRMVLVPPDKAFLDRQEKKGKKQLLNFQYELVAEPPTVIGEVDIAGAADSGTTKKGSTADGVSGKKTVSFRPSQGALLAALTGQEDLAAAAQESVGTKLGSAVGSRLLSIPLGLLVKLLNLPLGLIGADVSVGKSDLARQRDAAAASAAGPGAEGSGGGMGIVAGALDNTEVTIRRRIAKNLYVDHHAILLDSSSFMRRTSSNVTEQQSSAYGNITELSYRTSRYKGTLKYRWFGLPDDPKPEDGELFMGGQVNQMFHGVAQAEEFVW